MAAPMFGRQIIHAGMAELADALDLGSSGQPCGFDSHYPYQDVLTKEMHSKNTAQKCGVFAVSKRKSRKQGENVEKSKKEERVS